MSLADRFDAQAQRGRSGSSVRRSPASSRASSTTSRRACRGTREGSLIRATRSAARRARPRSGTSEGKYTYNLFNFSFVGYAGGDAPNAVIAVRIGEASPKVDGQGDLELIITSYQLFHRIATDALRAWTFPASDPNAGRPEPGSAAQAALDPARMPWLDTAKAGGSAKAHLHQPHDGRRPARAGGDQQTNGDQQQERRRRGQPPTGGGHSRRAAAVDAPHARIAAIVTDLPSASPATERPGFDGAGLAAAVADAPPSGDLSIRGGAVEFAPRAAGNASSRCLASGRTAIVSWPMPSGPVLPRWSSEMRRAR